MSKPLHALRKEEKLQQDKQTEEVLSRYLRKRSALIIIIASIIVLLIVLFIRDIPSRIDDGDKGRIALKILDEVRRPLLNIHHDIHKELSFPHNDNNIETVMSSIERGTNHSRSLIADFKSAAAYNPELLQRVENFANAFEDWIKKERAAPGRVAGISPDNAGLQDYDEVYRLIFETSESFTLTMSLLGDAEIPIHKDIHTGTQAVTEALILGGILLAGLIGMVLFLQWSKSRDLAKFPSENPYPVLRISKDGKILFANDAGLPLLNFWGSQIGKTLSGHWHNFVLNVLSSNSSKNTEIEYENRVLFLTFTPVVEAGYVNVYGLDITERKRAEEELGRIFDLSIDMICVCDIKKGYFRKINPAFGKTLGYSEEELLGRPFYDFIHPDDIGSTTNEVEEILATGKDIVDFENRYRCKDGSYRWFMWTAKPVTNEGITFAIARDITERKKMEEALLQSEKMNALGVMTSGVAHEFNNILGIISGNAQLMEEKYRDNEELAKSLRTICRVSDDGANIVDRMYKFTDVRKDTTGFISVDLRDLVKQAVDFTMPRWKNMAQANGINYYVDMEDLREVPAVFGNPSELREVFVNIINNALDAMLIGGRLSFSTWRKDNTVFVSISDTGRGMPEEVQKHIFDPFFTTRSPEGTGLGMSVTYGIITRHDGKIDVKSKVGKGSTFTLRFPISKEAGHPDISSKPSQEIKTRSLNILVVDDEQEMCEVLSDFFTGDGHKVKSAISGTDGISLLKREDFDLVLCDLAMPNVTGRDVIKELDTLDKRPKVGLITGWRYEMEDVKKEDLRVDFVVKKPFKFSELRRDINNIFSAG